MSTFSVAALHMHMTPLASQWTAIRGVGPDRRVLPQGDDAAIAQASDFIM